MIHSITIENFFSIAEKQSLTFAIPRNVPDLPCFITSRSNSNVRLPVAIGFFGANASGKTTILRAIVSIATFICYSFSASTNLALLFQAYRQKEWLKEPTKITIEFDGKLKKAESFRTFRYELHISNNDFTDKTISYESLSYAPKGKFRNLFERKGQEIHFNKEFANNNDPRKDTIRNGSVSV